MGPGGRDGRPCFPRSRASDRWGVLAALWEMIPETTGSETGREGGVAPAGAHCGQRGGLGPTGGPCQTAKIPPQGYLSRGEGSGAFIHRPHPRLVRAPRGLQLPIFPASPGRRKPDLPPPSSPPRACTRGAPPGCLPHRHGTARGWRSPKCHPPPVCSWVIGPGAQ